MSSRTKDAASTAPETVPPSTRLGRILLNLRQVAERMAGRYPDALGLEAEIVAIIGEETRGEGPIFCGPRSAEVWGDITEGKRRALVGDLARVICSRRPKGRRAAERIVDLLAERIGRVTVRAEASSVDFGKALETQAEGGGKLLSMGIRANADGRLDADEIAGLKTQIRAVQDNLIQLQVTLHEAEKGGAR